MKKYVLFAVTCTIRLLVILMPVSLLELLSRICPKIGFVRCAL